MTRQLDRQSFTPDVRITLAEHDLDRHDEFIASFERGMDRLNARLLGFIVTFTSSAVLLAADVALRN